MAYSLIINPGSTSRKYAFYRDDEFIFSLRAEIKDGAVSSCLIDIKGVASCENWPMDALDDSLARTLDWASERGLLSNKEDITKVAIRIVAPGELFTKHQLITDEFVEALQDVAYLVPIHIPIVLTEIKRVKSLLAHAQLVAASDSAFHIKALPATQVVSIGDSSLHKYGYHGLSAASIVRQLSTKSELISKKTIMIHIGGGVSVVALNDGVSIATSMGYTPASGLIMGTRGGDVSADVMLAYMKKNDLNPTDAMSHLYFESGFQAICGESDMRIVLERVANRDTTAELAFDKFLFDLQSTIASYVVLLGGVDSIVLTATALVRNPYLRKRIMSRLEMFNIRIDEQKNDSLVGKSGQIQTEDSIPVVVLETDEMGEMARILSSS